MRRILAPLVAALLVIGRYPESFAASTSTTTREPCGSGAPSGCGPFGVCRTLDASGQRCVCDRGYAGADCSLQAINCRGDVDPNGARTCFNGGRCVEKEMYFPDQDSTTTWYCDCSTATGDAKRFAGHQCQYPTSAHCEAGIKTSEYAFCVNGGRCIQIVDRGEPHPGCLCRTGFEGRHCQYAKGTAPAKEPIYSAAMENSTKGIHGFALALVILIVLGFVSCTTYVVVRRDTSFLLTGPVDVRSVIPVDLNLNEIDDTSKNPQEDMTGQDGNRVYDVEIS